LKASDIEFVVLAAGKSTRNYPHSKGLPHKSLMPIGSVKIIDKIMREPIGAGIKHISIVVSDEKAREAFEACFTREAKVEEKFEKSGNTVGLELLQSLYVPDDVKIRYVIQREPKGLAHAIGLAAAGARGRPVIWRYPDDLVMNRHVRRGGKPFVARLIDKYVADGGRGNLFATRKVDDPSRWGVIDGGVFLEKSKTTKSRDCSCVAVAADAGFAAVLAEAAERADTPGTKEYEMWENGTEIHFADYINDFVASDPSMRIRTFPMSRDDIYLDGGTIRGYEEAVLYSLLHESRFARENRKVAKAQFGWRKWLSRSGPFLRK
jgi:dTDP-glucose pyrophosphorylase